MGIRRRVAGYPPRHRDMVKMDILEAQPEAGQSGSRRFRKSVFIGLCALLIT